MIQRVQSVYFLLAGIFPAFTFCTPMAHYTDRDAAVVYQLTSWAIADMKGKAMAHPWGMVSLAVIVVIFSFVCLMAYRNRLRQIALSNLLISMILIYTLAYVAYGYAYGTSLGLAFLPQWGLVFPALSLVFAFLARRGVCKDEALVRAADRIR